MDHEEVSLSPVISDEWTDEDAELAAVVKLDPDSVDLLLRFLVGLADLGGSELTRRLENMQRQIAASPKIVSPRGRMQNKALRQRVRHVSLGLLMRGQRRVRAGVRSSYGLFMNSSRWTLGKAERATNNRLTRPVRRPMEARLEKWRKKAALVEMEGELEEENSRLLAIGTLGTLVHDLLDQLEANPELEEFVHGLIGQQGKGLASTLVDNSRSITLTADDAAENVLRWLLRRTPRRSLPPSPVEGKNQRMYEPGTKAEGGSRNGR